MRSFWQRHDLGAFESPTGRLDTDIAIIGAGYTGSWLAWWLKSKGLSVVVLERGTPGIGASGRNGGLLLQGPAQLLGEAAREIDRDQALELWQRTRESFDWVRSIATRHAVDFHVTGSLYLGGDPGERANIEDTVGLMNDAGIPARIVPPAEQPLSLQRLNHDLGAWVPDDAMIHPVKLIGALLTEAQALGVSVYANARVNHWDIDQAGVILQGDGFSVHAQTVLVATNSEIPRPLAALLEPLIHPVRGQMLATAPTEPLDYDYPVYANYGFNYWHQRPDGRIVAGGFRDLDPTNEVGTALVLHDQIQARLDRLLADLLPRPVPVTDRWSGIMAMTDDHRPYVGMINDRIGAAVGFNGHGSTVTPIAAKMLADALTEGTPVFAPFSIARAPGMKEASS